jgi:hypothetical protein
LEEECRRYDGGSNGFAVTLTFPKDGDPLETTIVKGNPGRIILM